LDSVAELKIFDIEKRKENWNKSRWKIYNKCTILDKCHPPKKTLQEDFHCSSRGTVLIESPQIR
jgi:hypothetical protein